MFKVVKPSTGAELIGWSNRTFSTGKVKLAVYGVPGHSHKVLTWATRAAAERNAAIAGPAWAAVEV